MTVFAWSALTVFTITTAALLAMLGKALFAALDRVDRARDDVWTVGKTLETVAARMERIELLLGGSDQRLDTLRDELRATIRRDMREILDGTSAARTRTAAAPN